MRKKVFGVKLGRNKKSRLALFRSLVAAMILNGKIETTKTKAKAVQTDIEKLMGLVVKNNLSSRRIALARLGNDKEVTAKLFGFSKLGAKRKFGFTRIVKLARRKGDGAEMARLEFVDTLEKEKKDKDKK